MHMPSASELISVWERGLQLEPAQRGLLLLAVIFPQDRVADLAQLSIGTRDAHLLALRGALFGEQLASLAACPQCGVQLELDLSLDQIRAPAAGQSNGAVAITVAAAGHRLRCRLPNSADLLAIRGINEPAAARQALLERCLIAGQEVGSDQPAMTLAQLPDHVVAAALARMAEADPQGDIQLAISCPNCAHRWSVQFDIVSFLWDEISTWAQHILREVHTLAWAYGWHEADILAMSAQRRQTYLQMLGN
jgi:hypothetical protein